MPMPEKTEPNRPVIAYWPVLAAVVSWTLSVVMANSMLSGPFEQRTCQTFCVEVLGISSFVAAVLGVSLGHRAPRHPLTIVALLLMLMLILMYVTAVLIGVLTG